MRLRFMLPTYIIYHGPYHSGNKFQYNCNPFFLFLTRYVYLSWNLYANSWYPDLLDFNIYIVQQKLWNVHWHNLSTYQMININWWYGYELALCSILLAFVALKALKRALKGQELASNTLEILLANAYHCTEWNFCCLYEDGNNGGCLLKKRH